MKQRKGGHSWGPVEGAKLRVMSCGAGVQSSTLALMAARGEIGPLPDAMIFADPGSEITATMNHLDWLESEVTRRTNGRMKCLRVGNGGLEENIRSRVSPGGNRFTTAPFFTENGGIGLRQCTREYKIAPLQKMQRELLGYKPRQRIPVGSCEVWIGISTDEVVRAGAAFERWIVNRYPLLEERMSRRDCIRWLERNGYPVPPKSACYFCPYRTNAEWRWLRDNDPEAWSKAVEIDRVIRDTPGMKYREYLHSQRVPLDQVDLSTPEQHGQGWLLECEGGCGV